MSKKLELIAKRDAAAAKVLALQAIENRTEEQNAEFDSAAVEVDSLQAKITEEENAERDAVAQRITAALSKPKARVVTPRIESVPDRKVWGSNAEFVNAVRTSVLGGGLDSRLYGAITPGASTLTGPEGGFAVPPDFRKELNETWATGENLLSLFTSYPTDSDVVTLPLDETTPHGSTGIQAYNVSEGAAITASGPVLKELTWTLGAKAALVHATDKILRNVALMSTYLPRKMGTKLADKVSYEVLRGSGVGGEMLGVLNSPALISVTRTAGGNAVDPADLLNMIARSYQRPGKKFWLIHSSVIPSLGLLSNGSAQLWQPDFREGLAGRLLGLPVVMSEHCSTAGTSGDIILCNEGGYVAFTQGGVVSDTSIHFAFDQLVNSFRSYVYIAGQPILQAALARKNGTDTLGDFVVLS
jgi:HK97 family phage major capsid protein